MRLPENLANRVSDGETLASGDATRVGEQAKGSHVLHDRLRILALLVVRIPELLVLERGEPGHLGLCFGLLEVWQVFVIRVG